jgi:hypothetical protein
MLLDQLPLLLDQLPLLLDQLPLLLDQLPLPPTRLPAPPITRLLMQHCATVLRSRLLAVLQIPRVIPLILQVPMGKFCVFREPRLASVRLLRRALLTMR